MKSESEVAQLCPTLCDPVDCSLPGSSVHGILQARILEWVAISFSRDLHDPGIEPRSPALKADPLLSEPPGKPRETIEYIKYSCGVGFLTSALLTFGAGSLFVVGDVLLDI